MSRLGRFAEVCVKVSAPILSEFGSLRLHPSVELLLSSVHHARHLLHLPFSDFVRGSRWNVEGMRQLGEVARFCLIPSQALGELFGLGQLVVVGLLRDAEHIAKLAVELFHLFGFRVRSRGLEGALLTDELLSVREAAQGFNRVRILAQDALGLLEVVGKAFRPVLFEVAFVIERGAEIERAALAVLVSLAG